jgi:hypothetical protein
MKLTAWQPLLFATGLVDLTYRCEHCEMITKRLVKDD